MFETKRLRLRPLTEADLPFFIELNADERVMRFLGTGRPLSEAETRERHATRLSIWEQERLGQLGVELLTDGRIIGRCGLSCLEVERGVAQPRAFWGLGSAPRDVRVDAFLELGYTFHPSAWGHGYATEAARRMRYYAFAERGVVNLLSMIHADNGPSLRVATRNGFTHEGTIESTGRVFQRYELSREAWERAASSGADDI